MNSAANKNARGRKSETERRSGANSRRNVCCSKPDIILDQEFDKLPFVTYDPTTKYADVNDRAMFGFEAFEIVGKIIFPVLIDNVGPNSQVPSLNVITVASPFRVHLLRKNSGIATIPDCFYSRVKQQSLRTYAVKYQQTGMLMNKMQRSSAVFERWNPSFGVPPNRLEKWLNIPFRREHPVYRVQVQFSLSGKLTPGVWLIRCMSVRLRNDLNEFVLKYLIAALQVMYKCDLEEDDAVGYAVYGLVRSWLITGICDCCFFRMLRGYYSDMRHFEYSYHLKDSFAPWFRISQEAYQLCFLGCGSDTDITNCADSDVRQFGVMKFDVHAFLLPERRDVHLRIGVKKGDGNFHDVQLTPREWFAFVASVELLAKVLRASIHGAAYQALEAWLHGLGLTFETKENDVTKWILPALVRLWERSTPFANCATYLIPLVSCGLISDDFRRDFNVKDPANGAYDIMLSMLLNRAPTRKEKDMALCIVKRFRELGASSVFRLKEFEFDIGEEYRRKFHLELTDVENSDGELDGDVIKEESSSSSSIRVKDRDSILAKLLNLKEVCDNARITPFQDEAAALPVIEEEKEEPIAPLRHCSPAVSPTKLLFGGISSGLFSLRLNDNILNSSTSSDEVMHSARSHASDSDECVEAQQDMLRRLGSLP